MDGIYSHEFAHFPKKTGGSSKLPLKGVCRVEKGGVNNAVLTAGYEDGRERMIYGGNVYDKPVIAMLEGVISLGAAAPAEETPTEMTFDEIFEEAMAQPAPQETPPPEPTAQDLYRAGGELHQAGRAEFLMKAFHQEFV